jgi:hypothetical protein
MIAWVSRKRVQSRRWENFKQRLSCCCFLLLLLLLLLRRFRMLCVTASPISFLQNSLFLISSFQGPSSSGTSTYYFVGDGGHDNHPSWLLDQPTVISGIDILEVSYYHVICTSTYYIILHPPPPRPLTRICTNIYLRVLKGTDRDPNPDHSVCRL